MSKAESELGALRHDIERHISISSQLATENEEMRALLVDAREALDFFKVWGESLNLMIGYNPTVESWKPTLDAISRIDEFLNRK